MKRVKLLILLFIMLLVSSCVSMKQYTELSEKLNHRDMENQRLNKEVMELSTKNTELESEATVLKQKAEALAKENEDLKYKLSRSEMLLKNLEYEKDELVSQLSSIQSGSSSEIRKLLEELQSARSGLTNREDKLLAAEKELEDKQSRLLELEEILKQKEQAVKELKAKVTNALTGFHNNGLTVYEKNGKVYVSLDEQLLFKTGQWAVDPKGQKALEELAKVLAQNKDINVMVEGHTDDVPMKGSGAVKDNWDLSVMRATAVTKILTKNPQVNPKQITSAGRGEYLPVDANNTIEARQKNRRTEIILTPKLDELLKIIESN